MHHAQDGRSRLDHSSRLTALVMVCRLAVREFDDDHLLLVSSHLRVVVMGLSLDVDSDSLRACLLVAAKELAPGFRSHSCRPSMRPQGVCEVQVDADIGDNT